MRQLADLLHKFNGFHSLNMSYLEETIKSNSLIELFKALKYNASLHRFIFLGNKISAEAYSELVASACDA